MCVCGSPSRPSLSLGVVQLVEALTSEVEKALGEIGNNQDGD